MMAGYCNRSSLELPQRCSFSFCNFYVSIFLLQVLPVLPYVILRQPHPIAPSPRCSIVRLGCSFTWQHSVALHISRRSKILIHNVNLLCCKTTNNLHGMILNIIYFCRQVFFSLAFSDKGEHISSSYVKSKIWKFLSLLFKKKINDVTWYVHTFIPNLVKINQTWYKRPLLHAPLLLRWVEIFKI